MKVPCRKCEKCLWVRATQWAARVKSEVELAPRSWFVTLTFSPEVYGSVYMGTSGKPAQLDSRAYPYVQRFLKRLRRQTGRMLRYYAAFETGDENGRGHYHALLHEVNGPITKRAIERAWGYGFVHARLLHTDSGTLAAARYVTSYLQKDGAPPRASFRYGKGKATVQNVGRPHDAPTASSKEPTSCPEGGEAALPWEEMAKEWSSALARAVSDAKASSEQCPEPGVSTFEGGNDLWRVE